MALRQLLLRIRALPIALDRRRTPEILRPIRSGLLCYTLRNSLFLQILSLFMAWVVQASRAGLFIGIQLNVGQDCGYRPSLEFPLQDCFLSVITPTFLPLDLRIFQGLPILQSHCCLT